MHISDEGAVKLKHFAVGRGCGAGQDNSGTQDPDNPIEKVGTSHKPP